MSLKLNKIKPFIFLAVIVAAGLFFLQRSFAATGQIYVSPATVGVEQNNNFTVGVRIRPDTNVDGVDVTVHYDQTKLQFISQDASSSPFTADTCPSPCAAGGGNVHLQRVLISGTVSSDSLISNLTFKALAGSGSSSMTLSGNAISGTAYTNPSLSSGTVNFSTPPPVDNTGPTVAITSPANNAQVAANSTVTVTASDTSGLQKIELYVDNAKVNTLTSSPANFSVSLTEGAHSIKATACDNAPAHNCTTTSTITVTVPTTNNGGGGGSGGSSGGTSGGGTSNTSGGSKSTGGSSSSAKNNIPAPQSVGGVTVAADKVQFTQVSFILTSSKPFTAFIEYGLDSRLGFTTPPTPSATRQVISLDSKLLIPGTLYNFRVVTIDVNGKRTQSPIQTFKTKGYTVHVQILDANHKPVGRKDVTLHSDPILSQTDRSGVAEFTDVSPGLHTVEYTKGDKKYSQQITVNNTVTTNSDGVQSAPTQNLSVVYKDLKQTSLPWTTIIVIVVILVVLAWLTIRYNRRRGGGNPFGSMWGGGGGDNKAIFTSTDTSSSESSANSDLISKVRGLKNPDPGNVVTPNGQNNENKS